MRYVDDFLLITRDPLTATNLTHIMGRGIPGYNCAINKEKGGANFKLDEKGQVSVDEQGSTPVLINIHNYL